MNPTLYVRDVALSYGQKPILRDVHMEVMHQEVVALIGRSGGGKSSLLHVIGGIVQPDAGIVRVNGLSCGRIGYMPQTDGLLPWRTVMDNVLLADVLADRVPNRARALERLHAVGLHDVAQSYPAQLSGGMRQRVSFVRALQAEAQLLVLDEPFGALDALTRSEMHQCLLSWHEQHTMLIVTHSIEEALLLGDRIVVLAGQPARLTCDMRSPLPRPRSAADVHDASMIDAKKQLWDVLMTK
jgi:putative hydroxymethylpyrimidine transport system ATP-binding protein